MNKGNIWSRDTNSSLPFALTVTLNLSNVLFAVTCPNSVHVLCLVVYKM